MCLLCYTAVGSGFRKTLVSSKFCDKNDGYAGAIFEGIRMRNTEALDAAVTLGGREASGALAVQLVREYEEKHLTRKGRRPKL